MPDAVVAANYNQFRARELHDALAGMTNGSGSLRNFFLFMQGLVDENGNPRTEDGNDDDGMSNYIDAANEREERRQEMRRDVEATLSEAQIDAVAWVGDPDQTYTFDGTSASRRQWLAGAKAARTRVQQKVANGEMTEDEGALCCIARRTTSVVRALPCRTWPIMPPSKSWMMHHQNPGSNS